MNITEPLEEKIRQLRAENHKLRQAAEQGQRIAEIANKHGWNGVENSKILSEFIDHELHRLWHYDTRNAVEKLLDMVRAFREGKASYGDLQRCFRAVMDRRSSEHIDEKLPEDIARPYSPKRRD